MVELVAMHGAAAGRKLELPHPHAVVSKMIFVPTPLEYAPASTAGHGSVRRPCNACARSDLPSFAVRPIRLEFVEQHAPADAVFAAISADPSTWAVPRSR
jgi:hypothetical protein